MYCIDLVWWNKNVAPRSGQSVATSKHSPVIQSHNVCQMSICRDTNNLHSRNPSIYTYGIILYNIPYYFAICPQTDQTLKHFSRKNLTS